jgi:hypothetical protein
MLSADETRPFTSRSISALDPFTSIVGRVQTGSLKTLAGKSHSCERPT